MKHKFARGFRRFWQPWNSCSLIEFGITTRSLVNICNVAFSHITPLVMWKNATMPFDTPMCNISTLEYETPMSGGARRIHIVLYCILICLFNLFTCGLDAQGPVGVLASATLSFTF
jgi:hypothetical protein